MKGETRLAKAKVNNSSEVSRKLRPALTPEARENQLIALAVDLVEKRLREGTASSQETTHFLKLGSTKNKLEMEKLEEENKLLRAKTESLASMKKIEELYAEAMTAFRGYSGQENEEEDIDDEY